MKIKIINPNTTDAVTKVMTQIGTAVAGRGTEIVAVSPQMGPSAIEGFYDEAFSAVGVLDEVRKGEADDCDGYVIACFGDPGLLAAREAAKGPVLGIAEAAMHAAAFIGNSFSIVSMVERVRPMIERVVHENEMNARCRSVRMVGIPLLEFETSGKQALLETCRLAVTHDKAECIVLGSGGLAEYAQAISNEIGVPVIDGVAVAVKFVEALVTLGLGTSKCQTYAFPPPKLYSGSLAAFSPHGITNA